MGGGELTGSWFYKKISVMYSTISTISDHFFMWSLATVAYLNSAWCVFSFVFNLFEKVNIVILV